MIWLSPMAGADECSVYFEIRDVEFRRTGQLNEGVIRGVLGDGQRELWGEVHLGVTPRVQVLPTWSEQGGEEGFAAAVDEVLLEKQLLAAVDKLICRFTAMVRTEEDLLPDAPAVCRRSGPAALAA